MLIKCHSGGFSFDYERITQTSSIHIWLEEQRVKHAILFILIGSNYKLNNDSLVNIIIYIILHRSYFIKDFINNNFELLSSYLICIYDL